MVWRGDLVCTSISFHFRARCRVKIRFCDNPRQKETIDSIIWIRRKKCGIYRLDIIFSITHVVQLMASKINLLYQRDICRYLWRDIGRKIPNVTSCQKVEECQWLIVSIWHLDIWFPNLIPTEPLAFSLYLSKSTDSLFIYP